VRELDALLIRSAVDSDGDGRYVELWRDPTATLNAASSGPPRVAEVDPLLSLSFVEERRLLLLRRHQFSPTRCGRDPDYPGNRQAADLHLRLLLCRALHVSDWGTLRAAALLAGANDGPLRDKAVARMETFLSNLRTRLAEEPGHQLQRALVAEWKGNAETVHQVIEALRAGKISLSSPPPRGSGDPA
jgi:hypothetical protein